MPWKMVVKRNKKGNMSAKGRNTSPRPKAKPKVKGRKK